MITIVLADDHPVVRAGLGALLGSIDGLRLVAEAADGHEAVREVITHRPDVVIMDIDMPGLTGIEATRQILRSVPGTAVLVLTMYEDDGSVFAAMRAGARGYLLKGAGPGEIERAVRAVHAEETIFGPGVAHRVLSLFSTAQSAPTGPFPTLTDREHDILELIAQGRPNGDIASDLCIARKTVANHISSIFAKLQVADRAEAIIRARDAGLGRG
jgi:DNA-binding NarL/FixJ family response regulator